MWLNKRVVVQRKGEICWKQIFLALVALCQYSSMAVKKGDNLWPPQQKGCTKYSKLNWLNWLPSTKKLFLKWRVFEKKGMNMCRGKMRTRIFLGNMSNFRMSRFKISLQFCMKTYKWTQIRSRNSQKFNLIHILGLNLYYVKDFTLLFSTYNLYIICAKLKIKYFANKTQNPEFPEVVWKGLISHYLIFSVKVRANA